MTRNNTIDYVELAAASLPAAKAFYAKAFGWTFQDYGPDYAEIAGAGLTGGLQAQEPAAPLVIIYADDLDAAEAAVRAAGGEILKRFPFPGGERFHFRDPAGNELAVWTQRA